MTALSIPERARNVYAIGGTCWPGLGKTTEEVGELLQVLGKLIASNGHPNHWDGTDLRERLIDEAGDVLGALRFLIRANGLPEDVIELRAAQKHALFCRWHAEHRADSLDPEGATP